jgi:hypothetical protein
MTKPQVQFDPMEQLMALLQFQQRNKQLRQQNEMSDRELALREQQITQQGNLGGRELDLRGEDMRQRGQQTEAQRQWEQEQFGKRNQQWEAEQQEKTLARALEQVRFARLDPIDEAYKKAQTERMLRPDVDPRTAVMEREGLRDRQVEYLTAMLQSEGRPIERQKLMDRLNEILNIQLRPDTPEEAKQRAMFGGQTK